MTPRRAIAIAAVLVAAPVALFGGEIYYAIHGFGTEPPFVNPSREPVTLGEGLPLSYVVIGDSTAAGQGGDYAKGIAMSSARFLAEHHRVAFTNLAVSGATTGDVVRNQLANAKSLAPDIVFIAVGANDATHFTPSASVARDAAAILEQLKALPTKPQIVVTGSPDLGAAPRFAQPLRWLAGVQSRRIDAIWTRAAAEHGAIVAPILSTGDAFRADPTLYSRDVFHPDDRGYATWIPLIDAALAKALAQRQGLPNS
jgi:lysophospholipase L1-like esterase